jgi:hypothetical protein
MNWKPELRTLAWIAGGFLLAYHLPVGNEFFRNAVLESFALLAWYAREHVLLCLVPAFFIAGTIAVFVSNAAVIRYFGARAKKWRAYLVASVSGSILAVCSCTVLPMFSGIHKRGAGLGPAIAFLYSGPAINILGIILTARVLGLELGIARVLGAVTFSVVIGLIMALLYRKEEQERETAGLLVPEIDDHRPFWQTVYHFFVLVGILVFATWGRSGETDSFWSTIHAVKWWIVSLFGAAFALSLVAILKVNRIHVGAGVLAVAAAALLSDHDPVIPFVTGVLATAVVLSLTDGEGATWLSETWSFAKQILPLLAGGVLIAGFLLGGPESHRGLIPIEWIEKLVGGNTLAANAFASVAGAFMYFATLTEIPIVQGLISGGMGKGPALALLLAGPALSLPSMLVIRSVIGTEKTVVYVALVIVMATASGWMFGMFF